jgi:hypothetical protein
MGTRKHCEHSHRGQATNHDPAQHGDCPVQGVHLGVPSFGSPADLVGPVVLRPRLAAGLPLSLTLLVSALDAAPTEGQVGDDVTCS